MRLTALDCLSAVRPQLPRELIADGQLRAVERLAVRLEGLSCAAFYLECRLQPSAANQVDLLAQVRPAADARPNPRLERGGVATESPLWLEFDDATGSNAASRLPGLHLRIDEHNGQPAAPFDAARACERLERLERLAILEPLARVAMQRCVRALPPGGRAIHASVMPSRVPAEAKLYVALPASSLGEFCARAGWQSDWDDPLRSLAGFYGPELTGDTLYCDLTFRSALAPSIGLVYSQWQVKDGVTDASRARVREHFVKRGLCSEAKSAALEAWVRSPLRGLARCVDLKVRARQGHGLDAKAYLGFAPVT